MPPGTDQLGHHGGNINAARRLFPDAPEPWIDLSTGINPIPYPVGPIPQAAWARLPDAAGLARLEAAARGAYGVPQSAGIVAAPGTQALLQCLPRAVPARRVGVLGFTYAEHERCWRESGAAVEPIDRLSDLAGYEVAIIVNPNNPDGRMVPPPTLLDAATAVAARGGVLIVDEAFADAAGPRGSLMPHLPESGAIVLRSFGKMFGLAGLRLGFAAAAPAPTARLRAALGPWAVSGPAIEIGRRALDDRTWLVEAVARLDRESARLDRLLRAHGFEIVGGTSLFRLGRRSDAQDWFTRLCRAGILTRPFPARPDWLRFGIPAPDEWRRLEAALGAGGGSVPASLPQIRSAG
jgi:cobalamin biosynthetic protein CobC